MRGYVSIAEPRQPDELATLDFGGFVEIIISTTRCVDISLDEDQVGVACMRNFARHVGTRG